MREEQGDFDEALRLYQLAVSGNPDDFRSLFNMALIFIDRRGDHATGVRALRRAIEVNADLERAHVYLGRSLVYLADPATHAEAERVLLRGLELEPGAALLPMAHLTLAELYRRTGRPAEAQRHQALGEQAQRGRR